MGITFWQGSGHEALDVLKQAIRLDSTDDAAYCNQGYALNELGRYQVALAVLKQAIRYAPTLAIAHAHKGYALEQLGRQAAYKRARALGYQG
jgi:Flp pilus assembly protein TadD